MKRTEIEHIIRAAGMIAQDNEIIIVGSQAILGQYPNAHSDFLVSIEADIYPKNLPERSDLIDGSIGEGSLFHDTFGYYAHGVSPTTAVLPAGWEKRLFRIHNNNTSGITGLCLEVNDLALSKYVAGREKDLFFTNLLAKFAHTDKNILLERLDLIKNIVTELKDIIMMRIKKDFQNRF